jgi:hypothetical protein
MDEYRLQLMKSILIELDDEMAASLERVAPARSRRRSEFVRDAIRRALWELEEHATREAYSRSPDRDDADAWFDPRHWTADRPVSPRRPRRTAKR